MSIAEEIENLIRPVLLENKFELVDLTYRKEPNGMVLRLFVDKIEEIIAAPEDRPAGSSVTLDDCERVSELVGTFLEGTNLLSNFYNLEVSSPGINRPLKNEDHFKRHLGQRVKVSLYAPLSEESKQKNFTGNLLSCENQMIEIEDVVSGKVKIPISAITKAHLDLI
jgi:ribosome maturation factor RimP